MKNEWASRIGTGADRTVGSILAPLGVPVAFIADSLRLLDAAMAACSPWCAGMTDPLAQPALIVRLAAGASTGTGVSLPIHAEGSRLWVGDEENGGHADADRGEATCRVPHDLLDDPSGLSDALLEPLVLFLLAHCDRTPLHAAAVVRNGIALVLAGPTGMGKSTLALNAAMRGWGVLSDDTVYVQTRPHLAVWGVPRPIHVFVDEAPPGIYPQRQRKGRRKSAIMPPTVTTCAAQARLIVLDRGATVALTAMAPATAMTQLMQLEPGFDLLRAQTATAVSALALAGVWRLTLTDDAGAAIAALDAAWPHLPQ